MLLPLQPLYDGVTLYVMTKVEQEGFGIGQLIGEPVPVVPSLPVHAYVVPGIFENRLIVAELAVANVDPEQTENEGASVDADGTGFTFTITVVVDPGQLLAVGVMVYVAVPATVLLVESVCAIELPDPALAPLTPD